MGTLSWILTILAANGALMVALLGAAPGNRTANRFLAALVGLIALRLIIYVLGFAGMYDDHPWITFAPLDASLAFGPLLWLYLVSLTRTEPPRRWRLHLLPAALQAGYSVACFALPLETKLAWYGGSHLELVEPAGLAAMLLSAATYLALAGKRQHDYQRWLDARFADRERWRLGWLTAVIIAFATMLATAIGATLVNSAIIRLDYLSRTPVIIASALLAYALGLLGWRHAGLDLPSQPISDKEPQAVEARPTRTGSALATWRHRIEVEGWWREEGLALGTVAKRLGVSERTLSRGLSGGGVTFNELINKLRVEAVQRAIAKGHQGDLLSIALDCGFSSKASFNRAFRRYSGTTPTHWRANGSQFPPIATAGVI